ncbi:MAG: hypothetical protein ACYTEQ_01705 [Planctomycetota bacterium]
MVAKTTIRFDEPRHEKVLEIIKQRKLSGHPRPFMQSVIEDMIDQYKEPTRKNPLKS